MIFLTYFGRGHPSAGSGTIQQLRILGAIESILCSGEGNKKIPGTARKGGLFVRLFMFFGYTANSSSMVITFCTRLLY